MSEETVLEPRESMEFDVVIVGAILSGAVIDPIAVDRLIPDWKEESDHPFKVPVTDDIFNFLTETSSKKLPGFGMPKFMHNHGNYIVSLGNVCRWLAEKAEGLGVEVYPGFAAAELIYDDTGAVKGVATGDMGLQKDGTPGPMHENMYC